MSQMLSSALNTNAATELQLFINGQPITTQATTLDQLITAQFGKETVATAINGVFVAANVRANTLLNMGDKIEALVPMQGG